MRLAAIIISVALFAGCSIPTLEEPDCTKSRDVVKSFYSFHFGNDMRFSNETLKAREKYLSPELNKLLGKYLTESDPFTLTNDLPRAFKLAGCTVVEPGKKTVFTVQLFWKDDSRSEQREISAETVKEGDKWLINNIYDDKNNIGEMLKH